jgi:hypothetical protein
MVLRAPQGAVLEFDEPLDLRQGRLAKLIGGSLRGQVTIRGTPSTPDADDDIEIVTRDVELDELEVQTNEMVQFRYGRSSGSGRGMMAKLTPREGAPQQAVAAKPGRSGRPAGDQGPNIGGVDSIRLDRDVKMRLEGVAGSFLPGREADAAPASAEGSAQASAQPPAPVLVSCRGSLCLNVSANVITLEDHVDVIRTTAESTTDHLACDLLAIMLARRDQQPGAAQGKRGSLEPVEIQAKGSPVVARAAANDGAAFVPPDLEPRYGLAELGEKGFRPAEAQGHAAPATLVTLEGAAGTEHWLGFRNFYVITRYNRSPMYALAVHQLADEIIAGDAAP